MTRQEFSHTRELNMSGWIREKLPDSSTGFLASDLDFILEIYKTKKIMLLEIKTRNSELKTWQRMLFNNIDKWLRKGIDSDWTYVGFNVIKFENTFFNDGKCYLNEKEINEEELISVLSLI